MSDVTATPVQSEPGTASPRGEARSRARDVRAMVSFSNVSALYIFVVVVAIFGLWVPDLFLRGTTARSILNDNAVIGLLALSLLVPLAAGVFDLSIGYILGLGSVTVAWMVGNGFSPGVSVLAALGACLLVGLLNAVVVVTFNIDSFIGTLATGSLMQALILLVSDNRQMIDGVTTLSPLATTRVLGIAAPVWITGFVALALWYVMQHTALGRSIYATGLGREAARLAGIRTERIRFASLLASALLAGGAGVVVTAIVGAGSPTIGPPYLIPAFAAAFLGATQFQRGLFNSAGIIVGVLLLGTVNTGLALVGVPLWTPFLFTGLVLIGAMALGGIQRRAHGAGAAAGTAA